MNEQLQSIIRLPVEIGDTDMFDLILKSNSITDEEKHDILIYSILTSTEPDFVQHVLDSGLNESLLNESDDGSTLLHYAAASDSEEILKLFLKKDKSLVTSKNGDGFTPLMISAIKTNNVDVIKTLIKAGSDINCLTNEGANIFILACGTLPSIVSPLAKAAATARAGRVSGMALRSKSPPLSSLGPLTVTAIPFHSMVHPMAWRISSISLSPWVESLSRPSTVISVPLMAAATKKKAAEEKSPSM